MQELMRKFVTVEKSGKSAMQPDHDGTNSVITILTRNKTTYRLSGLVTTLSVSGNQMSTHHPIDDATILYWRKSQ